MKNNYLNSTLKMKHACFLMIAYFIFGLICGAALYKHANTPDIKETVQIINK